MIKEPSIMDRPLWVAKKVKATLTKPPKAPNGIYKIIHKEG
jgi:hypothetical protein